MNKDQQKSQIDQTLQRAECLERGQRGDSSLTVSISQLSGFYKRIASDYDITSAGKDLIAYKGVDPTVAGRLIDRLKASRKETRPKESQKVGKKDELIRVKKLSEIIQDEAEDELDSEWNRIVDSTSKAIFKEIVQDEKHNSILSSEIETLQPQYVTEESSHKIVDNKKKAILFSRQLLEDIRNREIQPNSTIFCSAALHLIPDKDSIVVQYLRAVSSLLDVNQNDRVDVTIKFLSDVYRERLNYTSASSVWDRVLSTSSRDDTEFSKMLRFFWELFRSGLLDDDALQWFSNTVKSRGADIIMDQAVRLMLAWNKDTASLRSHDSAVLDEDSQNVYAESIAEIEREPLFQVFTDIIDGAKVMSVPEITGTIEDTLFVLLLPLHTGDVSAQALHSVQEWCRVECARKADTKMQALLLMLTFQFNAALECLLQVPDFYIETCHICFALYGTDLISQQMRLRIDRIVDNFCEMLPESDYRAAIVYEMLVTYGRGEETVNASHDRALQFVLRHKCGQFISRDFFERGWIRRRIDAWLHENSEKLVELNVALGRTAGVSAIAKSLSEYTLSELCEFVVSFSKMDLQPLVEEAYRENEFIRNSIRTGKQSGQHQIAENSISDYTVIPLLVLLNAVLMQSSEMTPTERIELFTASEKIQKWFPCVYIFKITQILKLVIFYDQNNIHGARELLENGVLPKRISEVSDFLRDFVYTNRAEKNEANGSLIPTAVYQTIVFLTNNDKVNESIEDLNIVNALFKVAALINLPIEISQTLESIYNEIHPLIIDIE